MRYVSTRGAGAAAGLPFCDILLDGLAPDGGLYLPEHYPTLTPETLDRWEGLLASDGYPAVAYEVLSLFVDDIPDADLRAILVAHPDPEAAADALVEAALAAGGRDNVTALVVAVEGSHSDDVDDQTNPRPHQE